MCHLILLLPVVAISLFWFFPLSIAVPTYGVVLIVSGWVYFLAIRAMRRPVQTGVEALMHSIGEVLGKEGSLFRVRVRSEVWNAESTDNLQPGDAVEVVSVDELRLKVRRISGPLAGNTFRDKDANADLVHEAQMGRRLCFKRVLQWLGNAFTRQDVSTMLQREGIFSI